MGVRYRNVPAMATRFFDRPGETLTGRSSAAYVRGLASAKQWYCGRIDPQKFRWVLSRMGVLVSAANGEAARFGKIPSRSGSP